MSQQLVKKGTNGKHEKVMPRSWIEAIKDKYTGQSLLEILQGFNMYFLSYTGNKENTRLQVPMNLRKRGLWVVYENYDNEVIVEWYDKKSIADEIWKLDSSWKRVPLTSDIKFKIENGSLYVSYNNGKSWEELGVLSDISITSNIVPDEEDITTIESEGIKILKFKDRDITKGKGYIILRTDKSLLEQMAQENTIYEIRYDFDLGGETLEVPVGCVLDFKGGSFDNGTISGDLTCIVAEQSTVFKNGISLKGKWNIENVYPEWFGAKGNNDNDDTNALQSAIDFSNIAGGCVKLSYKTYKVTSSINVYNNTYIQGSNGGLGYWNAKSCIVQYSPVPIINLKATSSRYIYNSLRIDGIGITYDSSVTLDENCIGIAAIEDIARIKGFLLSNVFVYGCYYGFRMACYDSNDRGFSLNSWTGCNFMRNVYGVYFDGVNSGTNWINLNSWRDCGFSENKYIGFSIRRFHSAQENLLDSCSIETNGYNNEDNYEGIGIDIQSNGGITTLFNCYLENNVSKKLKEEYDAYVKDDINVLASANVRVVGGTICIMNSVVAGSPNHVLLAWKGSSCILENNHYVNSIGALCCMRPVTVANISASEAFLTSIKMREHMVNALTGALMIYSSADIRGADIDIELVKNDHAKYIFKYNSLTYFDYDTIYLSDATSADNVMGFESDNGFNGLGKLLRSTQTFKNNIVRCKFLTDIVETSWTSDMSNADITIDGNDKTWTFGDGAINSTSIMAWSNCKVVIKNLTINLTNTKQALNFMNFNSLTEVLFLNCKFNINVNKATSFLGTSTAKFVNCEFSGSTAGGAFYLYGDKCKFYNTTFPFKINYNAGATMYDSSLGKMKLWNGSAWVNLDGSALS